MPVDSDRDVFKRFMEDDKSSRQVALLAFASYAERKYDWEAHYETRHDEPPGGNEIERWIKDLSDAYLNDILNSAIDYWDDAARNYMADQIAVERQQAVDQSISSKVEAIRSRIEEITTFRSMFWPHTGFAVIGSFFFAILIILAGWIFNKDPSPFAFFKQPEPAATAPVSAKP